jgi:signal transduction histidine kinase
VKSFLNAEAPDLSVEQIRSDLARKYGREDQGKHLEIVNEKCEFLYFSDRNSRTEPLPILPQRAGVLLPPFRSVGDFQVLSLPMIIRGQTYEVSTALSMQRSRDLLWSFFRSLLILAPVLLMTAGAAGHVISRKALAPVAAITAAARHINDKNLSTKLPVTDTQDEIGDLSRTLNLMLERIDAAFSSVRAFTANASHELRTPVALIRTRVEIAQCFPRTPDQYRDVLMVVQASTEHMTATLDSLLLLARADAGAEHLQCKPLELTVLLQGVYDEWRDTAQRLDLRLSLQSSAMPIWIEGDVTALRRLLHILLDNACRHTSRDGRVELALESTGSKVTIEVSDTGTGIAANDLPYIFDRFYRTKTAPVNSRIGSGLGLSLAKWIAQQHSAELTVESKLQRGSGFRLLVPVIDSKAGVDEAALSH